VKNVNKGSPKKSLVSLI